MNYAGFLIEWVEKEYRDWVLAVPRKTITFFEKQQA
jgi:hypothetical protein